MKVGGDFSLAGVRSALGALALVTLLWSPAAPASADDELHPGLRLGIGPQFATSPNSRMLTGQTLVGLDYEIDDNLHVTAEIGYSGERRGRLAGRHFVFGGAIRMGSILGLGGVIHGMIGRTRGEDGEVGGLGDLGPVRSGGLRVGGRVDVGFVAGVDIQYEYRALNGFDGESGFRVVFWFDALFALKVVNN